MNVTGVVAQKSRAAITVVDSYQTLPQHGHAAKTNATEDLCVSVFMFLFSLSHFSSFSSKRLWLTGLCLHANPNLPIAGAVWQRNVQVV